MKNKLISIVIFAALYLFPGFMLFDTAVRYGNITATGTLTSNGDFTVNGSTGLGAGGTGGQTAGGFGTPSAIRHYCGDGTGWRCEFAKRISSVDTVEAWITDGGVINAANGYQVAGVALASANLSDSSSVVKTTATQTLSAKTLISPIIGTGISQGSGLKHQRAAGCTTGTTTGATCSITLTWTTAFADANYTVSCSPVNSGGLGAVELGSKAAASIAVGLVNINSGSSTTASTFDCIAIHD
jgi:hypothetical protein